MDFDDNLAGSSTLQRIAQLNEDAVIEQLRQDGIAHKNRERLQNVQSERQVDDEKINERHREAAEKNPYPHKLRD
jgi:hypothetical protein